MNKQLKYSLLIIFIVIIALALRKPVDQILNYFYSLPADKLRNNFISDIISRFLIISVFIYFIFLKRFTFFNGLKSSFSIKDSYLLLLPVFFLVFIGISNQHYFIQANKEIILLFTINALFTGLLEEITFRGMVLPLLISNYAATKHTFFKAIFLTSLLFGTVHFINVINHPENIQGVISQVIFAIGIGFYLAALLLRTGNILVPVTIHFLINFVGSASSMLENNEVANIKSDSIDISNYFSITLISIVFIAISMFMVRFINKEEWINKSSLIKI